MANDASMVEQDVAFTARFDGSEQRYVLWLPADLKPGEAVTLVFALHGHGSDRWQFVRETRDECQAARDVIQARRCVMVSPDYRAKTSWMGPAAEADMLQIIDELKQRFVVRSLIMTGGSMGGASALIFTALHPQLVDGVVSLNGTADMQAFANFPEAIAASYGGSREAAPEVYRQRSPVHFADRFTMPIATVTSGRDEVVPAASVLQLMEAVKAHNTNASCVHRPDAGHSTNYADTHAAYTFVLDAVATHGCEDEAPHRRA